MTDKPVTAYEDFAPAQRRAAVAKDLELICSAEQIIVESKKTAQDAIIAVVNAVYAQGHALRRICGHEQVTFEFVRKMQAQLPWGMNTSDVFDKATARVNLSHQLKGPVEKWEDIELHLRKPLLQQAELLQLMGRGLGDGHSAPLERFATWMADMCRFKEAFIKCNNEKPLEDRSPTQLRDFLKETEWLSQERERAAKLLKEKI